MQNVEFGQCFSDSNIKLSNSFTRCVPVKKFHYFVIFKDFGILETNNFLNPKYFFFQ